MSCLRVHAYMSNQFNILSWSSEIPLCDDVWLGMQARNIAMVDLSIIRPMEADALAAYMKREKTPLEHLLPLSALSQMWSFSLYEFLRTWRQRAKELLELADAYNAAAPGEQKAHLDAAVEKAKERDRFASLVPSSFSEHVAQIADVSFMRSLRGYYEWTEPLFREAEVLRVTLAKHEVPKTKGMFAEAPGYGRMSYRDGSIYWFINLKDGSSIKVDRRELANTFLGIEDDEV